MDTRKKNILLAAAMAVIAISLYAFSIYKVIASKAEPTFSGQQR